MKKQMLLTAPTFKVWMGYGGKEVGNVSPAFGDDAEDNERAFVSDLGVNDLELVRMNPQGKDQIIDLSHHAAANWTDCDGLITKSADQALALYAADCIPLLLWSTSTPLLALIHLGRQGATLGLAHKAVQYLAEQYSVPPAELHGWIGPSIKQSSYTFRPEDIAERFDASWQPYLEEKEGVIRADILSYVLQDLRGASVKSENIANEPIDTGTDEAYFSHHRAQVTHEAEGRNVLIAYLDLG